MNYVVVIRVLAGIFLVLWGVLLIRPHEPPICLVCGGFDPTLAIVSIVLGVAVLYLEYRAISAAGRV